MHFSILERLRSDKELSKMKSDLRLRRHPIKKKLKKGPDHYRKVERGQSESMGWKNGEKKMDVRSQRNEVGDVRSQKKVKNPNKLVPPLP